MKKTELVYRQMLEAIEDGKRKLTQSELASALRISISTVNHALMPLRRMGAVSVSLRSFSVVNPKKVLMLWASLRNIEKDILYSTHSDMPVKAIEKSMPQPVIFAAYSAYRLMFKDAPADYSEVYVYGNAEDVQDRFPFKKGPPNIFVLKKQFVAMTKAQIFVDLWNMKEWYAKAYLDAMERRLDGILA